MAVDAGLLRELGSVLGPDDELVAGLDAGIRQPRREGAGTCPNLLVAQLTNPIAIVMNDERVGSRGVVLEEVEERVARHGTMIRVRQVRRVRQGHGYTGYPGAPGTWVHPVPGCIGYSVRPVRPVRLSFGLRSQREIWPARSEVVRGRVVGGGLMRRSGR